MAAKMRKQHFGIFVLQKLLIITVTDYAADCFIERSLMLWIAEAIDKNEICVSVNGSGTMKIEQLLPFLFHYNCLFHKTEHWHFSLSSRSFRRIDIKIAAFFASREKMLDVSVCITLEAAILITFCFDCFSGMRTRDTAFKRSVTFLLHLYPGLLIGGVLCYILAELLFSFPGIDFNMLSWTVATTTFLLIGVGARLLQILLGDKALRLEILFIVNLFIVVLSIIATGY